MCVIFHHFTAKSTKLLRYDCENGREKIGLEKTACDKSRRANSFMHTGGGTHNMFHSHEHTHTHTFIASIVVISSPQHF